MRGFQLWINLPAAEKMKEAAYVDIPASDIPLVNLTQQSFVKVIAGETELNGKTVRLGGYPVPLESDAEGRSTLFFLVPYPGACIHVPPPPPNQIVLVRYPKGILLDDIYAPLWVEGPLQIETVSNDLADAAYALKASSVRVVEEADL